MRREQNIADSFYALRFTIYVLRRIGLVAGDEIMNLYILRHGIAVEHGAAGYENDDERPLTGKGERKMWSIAEAIKALGISFDTILSSPLVRAHQTAEIVAESLKCKKRLELTDTLSPQPSAKPLIEYLQEQGAIDDVLLVGHEPFLSQFISLLISGDTETSVLLKKGGFCKISTDHLKQGKCATLEWLLTAKQMELMA
jgi:phosphohistidine phosphatase